MMRIYDLATVVTVFVIVKNIIALCITCMTYKYIYNSYCMDGTGKEWC